jgi:YggT family protein
MNSTAQILSVFIRLVASFVEGLLGIRFVLKLFGASTRSTFVSWVFQNTEPLLNPFKNMFPSPALSGFAIEFSTLFALIIYALIGFVAVQAVEALSDTEFKLVKKPRKSDKK